MVFDLSVTNDAIIQNNLVSFQSIAMVLTMILKKQSNPSARWDNTANSWWIGESSEYQWTDMKDGPVSPWLTLDNALIWIKEYDRNQKMVLER